MISKRAILFKAPPRNKNWVHLRLILAAQGLNLTCYAADFDFARPGIKGFALSNDNGGRAGNE